MKYRPEIDGLRAIAVTPVIFFHAGFELFRGGYVGVDVFFVISGYLITSIIYNEKKEGVFSIVNFYERRARRILPALFLVVMVCIFFSWLLPTPEDIKNFSQSAIAVSTFSSNILFWLESGYFTGASELKPLLHTWSLALEEQYYLIFPIFIVAAWRLGDRGIITLLIITFIFSLSLAHWGSSNKPVATFYLLPTRVWEILIGVFAAFYLQNVKIRPPVLLDQIASFTGLVLILYSMLFFNEFTPPPSLLILIPTVGTALIIISGHKHTIVASILGTKPLVLTGLISYSAYLWHQPLLAFLKNISFNEHGLSETIIILIITVVLSIASYKWVEKPFRSKNKISRTKIFGLSAFVACLISLVGILGHVSDGRLFNNFDPSLDAQFSALTDWEYPGALHKGPFESSFVSNQSAPPKVLVFGDSHAEQYGPLVSTLTKQAMSVPTLFLTKSGCPPLPNVYVYNQPHCEKLVDRLNQVLSYYPTIDTIIIAACFNCYFIEGTTNRHDLWISKYPKLEESKSSFYFKDEKGVEPFRGSDGKRRAIEKFSDLISILSKDYSVAIILDNPLSNQFDPKAHIMAQTMSWNPYFDKKYPNFSKGKFALDEAQLKLTEELKDVLAQHDVKLIDPNPIVCPSNTCKSKDATGKFIYKDKHHMRPFFIASHFEILNNFFLNNSNSD